MWLLSNEKSNPAPNFVRRDDSHKWLTLMFLRPDPNPDQIFKYVRTAYAIKKYVRYY